MSVPIFSTGRPSILRYPGEIRVINVLHAYYFPLAIPIHANARKGLSWKFGMAPVQQTRGVNLSVDVQGVVGQINLKVV
jgi:hypothetical protein